jgi:hypothetical protein
MTTALLIVFVIAALVIAGFALEKHSQKTREELTKELDVQEPEQAPEPVEEQPTLIVEEKPVEVKQMVESQEEAPAPKPANKRRRGRPAAKKD